MRFLDDSKRNSPQQFGGLGWGVGVEFHARNEIERKTKRAIRWTEAIILAVEDATKFVQEKLALQWAREELDQREQGGEASVNSIKD